MKDAAPSIVAHLPPKLIFGDNFLMKTEKKKQRKGPFAALIRPAGWLIFPLNVLFIKLVKQCFSLTINQSEQCFQPSFRPANGATLWSCSAYLIIRIIQLIFSDGTVFFSHNNSARTVFLANSVKF